MSTFYGTVEGQRGPATRCGSSISGIKAAAQSWNGSVVVNLHYEGCDPNGNLLVDVNTSDGSSAYGHSAWRGTFEQFKAMLADNMHRREVGLL